MSNWLAEVLAEARSIPALEAVAVVAAVLYLLFAIRERIACWYFAALSSGLYVYILIDARLYMESALNVFYFAMAIYGWFSWRSGGGGEPLPVSSWPLRTHTFAIAGILALSLASGAALSATTDAALPYVDSATTWAALWATFLVARKVLENWWYWLVIDATLIVVFTLRELELTAGLFGLYVLMIPFGYLSWRQSFLVRKPATA